MTDQDEYEKKMDCLTALIRALLTEKPRTYKADPATRASSVMYASCAEQRRRKHVTIEDLYSAGVIGLLDVLRQIRPTQGKYRIP